ncbi:L,D-transpeptidase family protein [Streptomyces sp. NRRL WC-3744]|uniref:L,D-transpeptidase family protein n=1 Tax=Streptomyces sp. NRRL WC-3744 TaxID=1463935 RepID=UPI0004C8B257|nr:L,D-transpeptidase family protein [Streptomyces sp. NRRL WC-3744]
MSSSYQRAGTGRHRAPSTGDRLRALLAGSGRRLPLSTAALVAVVSVSGCGTTGATTAGPAHGARAVAPDATPSDATPATVTAADPASATVTHLPGLGPKTSARIPANARQVVLVTGQDKNSSRSHVVLYRRTASVWEGGATWPAHNALKGWTTDHHLGDLRSPIGVFTLSDAGGLLSDPGSKLPYTRSGGFAVGGTGFDGESLAGSFDYVVAIDYNRVRGTSPLDWTRPQGADKGGGIWLHVDHGGPTHACVSLSQEHMRQLLRTLDPTLHPVIVMGDAASLAE